MVFSQALRPVRLCWVLMEIFLCSFGGKWIVVFYRMVYYT